MRKRKSTLVPLITGLAFVLVALGAGSLLRKAAGTTLSSQTGPETHVAAPGKRALLVGIDNYEFPNQVSPLAGALNEVRIPSREYSRFEGIPSHARRNYERNSEPPDLQDAAG